MTAEHVVGFFAVHGTFLGLLLLRNVVGRVLNV